MRIAYADPPYIGQAKKHYGKEETYGGEVDHAQLVVRLKAFDGWALSASSPSLHTLLPLCPSDARVGAWVKPFASFKPGVNPAYAWEPVIFVGGRQKRDRSEDTVRDWVSAPITLKRGLAGAKPQEFCFWLFDLMGMQPGDEFHDIYPGTGGVTLAWHAYQRQMRLPSLTRTAMRQRDLLVDLGAGAPVLAAVDRVIADLPPRPTGQGEKP